jgi:hypothetical protein
MVTDTGKWPNGAAPGAITTRFLGGDELRRWVSARLLGELKTEVERKNKVHDH